MTAARHRPVKAGERGIILPGVLIILAFASAVVMMMLSLQDVAIQRSRRFNEAAQARAYVRGGELSAITALRRDGRTAPETDNASEPWAHIADSAVTIENGVFTLSIADEQARFNINNLADGNLADLQIFTGLTAALGLPPTLATRVADLLRVNGPAGGFDDLAQAGLSSADLAQLSSVAVVLPLKTSVNINAADERLIAALTGNRVAARRIVALRERKGFLTTADLDTLRVLLPPGMGFTSNFFRVETTVTIGDTAQSSSTLLQRTVKPDTVSVIAIERASKRAAPSPAPP